MTKKELKTKLIDIIERKETVYQEYCAEVSNTPQVRIIMLRVDAEIIVFNAVLDALNNNNVLINTY